MKVVKLGEMTLPGELTEVVNETMATSFKIVPMGQNKKDKSLQVAMAEPQNPLTMDSLRSFLGVEIKPVIAAESDVLAAITRLYAGKQESIGDVVKAIESDKGLQAFQNRNENTIDLEAIEEMAEAAPVRKLLNMVLLLAIRDKASDIHFEPFEEEVQDGVPGRRRALRDLSRRPGTQRRRSRRGSSVMANLGHRRAAGSPQDGRIQLAIGGAERRHPGARPPSDPSARASSCGSSTGRSVPRLDLNEIEHAARHPGAAGRELVAEAC